MIDSSALFMLAMIGSVFMWIVLLFKIVLSPLQETVKWKLVGVLFVFALCYIFVPSWVVDTFKLSGYGVPALLVNALFVGLVVMYFLITSAIKRQEKIKNAGR
ncbi:MAG TPA: hypothetical protein PLO73_14910 [Spirochaetota bacterium]|nr:hypothetical protein [Spirochaetota bacterium]